MKFPQFYELSNQAHPLEINERNETAGLHIVKGNEYLAKRRIPGIHPYKGSIPQKIITYAIKKPIKTSGILVVLALLVFILNPKFLINDNNPDHLFANKATSYLEVYNKENKKLWEVLRAAGFNDEMSYLINSSSRVIDIDGDGKNEIISIINGLEENEKRLNLLKVFNYQGKLINQKEFGEKITFRGSVFFNEYITSYYSLLLLSKSQKAGDLEIFLNVNNTHSPMILFRLDSKLNILGEYWHYGYNSNRALIDMNNDGNQEILLSGNEDVNFFPVICVLDPQKIFGKTEATYTSGFGFEPSKAEIFYIRLPNPPNIDAITNRPSCLNFRIIEDSTFEFEWKTNYPIDNGIYVYYYFTKDMKILKIEAGDAARKFYRKLYFNKKIKEEPNQEYYTKLKDQIEYWDGKEWKKEWTKVVH